MDLRSQAVSVLIKEQQNVNKATVILPASPAVTASVLPILQERTSYKDYGMYKTGGSKGY
jgi:hypothetical protein